MQKHLAFLKMPAEICPPFLRLTSVQHLAWPNRGPQEAKLCFRVKFRKGVGQDLCLTVAMEPDGVNTNTKSILPLTAAPATSGLLDATTCHSLNITNDHSTPHFLGTSFQYAAPQGRVSTRLGSRLALNKCLIRHYRSLSNHRGLTVDLNIRLHPTGFLSLPTALPIH